MRKILGILTVSVLLGISLVGCETQQASKVPARVGTAAPGAAMSTSKGGSPAVAADEPQVNPGATSSVGTKTK